MVRKDTVLNGINVSSAKRSLRLAHDLTRNAMEDLKNIEDFRVNQMTVLDRERVLSEIDGMIEWCLRKEAA